MRFASGKLHDHKTIPTQFSVNYLLGFCRGWKSYWIIVPMCDRKCHTTAIFYSKGKGTYEEGFLKLFFNGDEKHGKVRLTQTRPCFFKSEFHHSKAFHQCYSQHTNTVFDDNCNRLRVNRSFMKLQLLSFFIKKDFPLCGNISEKKTFWKWVTPEKLLDCLHMNVYMLPSSHVGNSMVTPFRLPPLGFD